MYSSLPDSNNNFADCLRGGQSYWLGSIKKVSVMNVISHITFTHGFNPYYINSILGVEWYLADLFIYYAMTPILVKYITSLKRAGICFVLGAIISVVFLTALGRISPIQDSYIWESYIGVFGFWCQFPVWMAGIVLYYVVQREVRQDIKHTCTILIGTILFYGVIRMLNIQAVLGWGLWAIVFVNLIISEIKNPYFRLKNSFIEYCGKNSYSIMLFHYITISIVNKYMGISVKSLIDFVIEFSIVILLTIIITSVINRVKLITKNV